MSTVQKLRKELQQVLRTPEYAGVFLSSKSALVRNELRYAILEFTDNVHEYFRDEPTINPKTRILKDGEAKQTPLILLPGYGLNIGSYYDLQKKLRMRHLLNVHPVGVDFFDPVRETSEGRIHWRVLQIREQTRISRLWEDVGDEISNTSINQADAALKPALEKIIMKESIDEFSNGLNGILENARQCYLRDRVRLLVRESEKTKISGEGLKVDILGYSLNGLSGRDFSLHHQDLVHHLVMEGAPNEGTYVAILGYYAVIGDIRREMGVLGKTDHVGKSGRRGYDVSWASARDMMKGSKYIKYLNSLHNQLLADNALEVKMINFYSSEDEALLLASEVPQAINFDVAEAPGIAYRHPERPTLDILMERAVGIGHMGLLHNEWLIGWITRLLKKAFNGHYHNLASLNTEGIILYLDDVLQGNMEGALEHLRNPELRSTAPQYFRMGVIPGKHILGSYGVPHVSHRRAA